MSIRWYHAEQLQDVVLRRCGALVSPATLYRRRQVKPLDMPCTEREIVAWWKTAARATPKRLQPREPPVAIPAQ